MHGETADSRNADAEAMLDFAFANYALCSLRGDTALPEVRVELGKSEFVPAVFSGDEYAVVARSSAAPEYSLSMDASVPAPVHAGDRLGTLTVSIAGENVASVPIVAGADVQRLGYFGLLGLLGGSLIGL